MCNIKNTKKEKKSGTQRIVTAARRRIAAAMFGFVPSASAVLLEVGTYTAGIISLCHTPGIEHVVTPIQIVDLLNDKISTTIIKYIESNR